MTTLFLIRHGETFANRLDYIQGTLDTEMTLLTDKGRKEAESYRGFLEGGKIGCVYTSPLKRAFETTQIICADSSLPVIVDQRLTELSYGQWNGTAIAELKKHYGKYFDSETNDVRPFSTQISKGESFTHARRRLLSFLTEVTRQNRGKRILIVTHGWVIKNMVALCLPKLNNFSFKNPHNLSLTKIEIDSFKQKKRVCYYDRQFKQTEKSPI